MPVDRDTLGHVWTETRANGKTVRMQSPTYQSYRSMLDRCYRSKHPRFYRYGGREENGAGDNIVVCDRWRYGTDTLSGFRCFLEDMGPRPSVEMSLDRENKDGNYEKDNCKWATEIEQNRNRSNTKLVTIDGVEMPLGAAIDAAGVRSFYPKILSMIWRGTDAKEAIAIYAARLGRETWPR